MDARFRGTDAKVIDKIARTTGAGNAILESITADSRTSDISDVHIGHVERSSKVAVQAKGEARMESRTSFVKKTVTVLQQQKIADYLATGFVAKNKNELYEQGRYFDAMNEAHREDVPFTIASITEKAIEKGVIESNEDEEVEDNVGGAKTGAAVSNEVAEDVEEQVTALKGRRAYLAMESVDEAKAEMQLEGNTLVFSKVVIDNTEATVVGYECRAALIMDIEELLISAKFDVRTENVTLDGFNRNVQTYMLNYKEMEDLLMTLKNDEIKEQFAIETKVTDQHGRAATVVEHVEPVIEVDGEAKRQIGIKIQFEDGTFMVNFASRLTVVNGSKNASTDDAAVSTADNEKQSDTSETEASTDNDSVIETAISTLTANAGNIAEKVVAIEAALETTHFAVEHKQTAKSGWYVVTASAMDSEEALVDFKVKIKDEEYQAAFEKAMDYLKWYWVRL